MGSHLKLSKKIVEKNVSESDDGGTEEYIKHTLEDWKDKKKKNPKKFTYLNPTNITEFDPA